MYPAAGLNFRHNLPGQEVGKDYKGLVMMEGEKDAKIISKKLYN